MGRGDSGSSQYGMTGSQQGMFGGQQSGMGGSYGSISQDSPYIRGGRTSGAFSGVGPKNYSRSKERVIEDVNQKLTDHHELDASEIEVTCENGEVILKGKVESRQAKRLAEDLAEQVSGVTDVRNELKVSSSNGTASAKAGQREQENGSKSKSDSSSSSAIESTTSKRS